MRISAKLAAAALGLACLAAGGCGSPAPAATANPDQARTALREVLESWKRGDACGAPAKLSPAILVADEDWLAGAKLEDYTIEPGDQMMGTALRCPVSLKIQDPEGKPRTRVALYIVTTDPILRVDRQDSP
jgi:hypothetical protein